VSRTTLAWIIAGVVAVLLTTLVLKKSTFDGSEATATDTSPREYGSRENMPSGSATRTDGVANEIAVRSATNGGSPDERENDPSGGGSDSGSLERDSMDLEATNEAADAYRVSGRRARNFDRELLTKSGFEETEIDEIAQGMRDYASWLRDSNDGELPAPPIKLSTEEREQRREVREELLSDEQYRAALFATGQKNVAFFAKVKEGSKARDAGIRSGDKLASINGESIFDLTDFADGRDQMAAGGMHILVVVRGGDQTTILVECCRPGWGPVDMTTQVPSSVGSAE
jgi:hypothetical protein